MSNEKSSPSPSQPSQPNMQPPPTVPVSMPIPGDGTPFRKDGHGSLR